MLKKSVLFSKKTVESKTSWQGGWLLGHLGRFISFPTGGCFSSPSSPHAWTKNRFFVHKMFIKMVYFKNNTFITLIISVQFLLFHQINNGYTYNFNY